MENFNFKSQISTNEEQSERLLALGIKPETADMTLRIAKDVPPASFSVAYNPFFAPKSLPAWSLPRLLEMLGLWHIELWYNTDVYEQVLRLIEERIEDGFFPEKYSTFSARETKEPQSEVGELTITLKQSGRTGGDCTAPYDVDLSRPCTLQELIKEILARKEWGYIWVKGVVGVEYTREGKIRGSIPAESLTRNVKEAKASGGWSRMDYDVLLD